MAQRIISPWTNMFSLIQTQIWLVVSTHLKNISQNGNLPQIGVKIKNIWNHHLVVTLYCRVDAGRHQWKVVSSAVHNVSAAGRASVLTSAVWPAWTGLPGSVGPTVARYAAAATLLSHVNEPYFADAMLSKGVWGTAHCSRFFTKVWLQPKCHTGFNASEKY